MHQRLDDFMVQTGLYRVKTLVPAYPQGHLAMKSCTFPARGTGFIVVAVVVHNGKGVFALSLKHHVKTQPLFVKSGPELEGHGRAFYTAGDFAILPV